MHVLAPAVGELLEKTLDATYPHWHDGLSRMAYGRWFSAQLATAWGQRHLTRWALLEGDALLGTAKLYMLDAVLDGRPLRIGGIGAVFTVPDARGRGVGRELVSQLVDRAAAEGADAALLFSEIDPSYYARLGFSALPTHDLSLRVIEDARRGAPATMVRAGDDRDIGEIVSMDAARMAPFRFHLSRDRDLVRYAIAKKRVFAGLSPAGARELQFFVAEEGSSAVAYVVLAVQSGVWTVESCGDRDPAGARLGAILQVLIAREPSQPRPAIKAWLPPAFRPPQIAIDRTSPSTDVMMIRPITNAARDTATLSAADVCYWKGDLF